MRRTIAWILSVALLAAACGSGNPSAPPTAVPTRSPSPAISATLTPGAPSPTPSASPGPGSSPSLTIDDLPRVDLATVDATGVCDPMPSQANPDAGDSAIGCSDGLRLALRDLRTVTHDPVIRLYLRRPACAQIPCSGDELNTAQVILWTATQAFSIPLDARLQTVAPPSLVADPAWPAADDRPAPGVRRPTIRGAPRAVTRRVPYPFCGRIEIGDPPQVLGCFRDAVLTGRRAELVQRLYGTEGGEVLRIFRYEGSGRVTCDQRVATVWRRIEGAMVLGITPLAWDLDPWTETRL